MSEFDIKAADWDKNPMHWDRSNAIAEQIKKNISLKPNMQALEYGAGTGILSFLLKDEFEEITLMDNSEEMLKIITQKIEKTGVKNLSPLFFDLEHNEYSDKKFDVIYTQMVLHHVIDVDNIINRFHNLLKPEGYLLIADLYEEDGTFHDDSFNGHKGFDIQKLSEKLIELNFHNISHNQCFVVNKKISEIETKLFPVFLLVANAIKN